MKRLAVLGASGHGRVIGDAALCAGWRDVVFFDDRYANLHSVGPWSIIGSLADMLTAPIECDGVIVAIGDNHARLDCQRQLVASGLHLTTLIHPAAVVSQFATLGAGSVVLAGAVVGPFSVIGDAVIINTGATVDHDCVLADGVHVSPGSHLGGAVRVGEESWIGIGAAVRQGIAIGSNVIVGAGAVAVRDVLDGSTVIGVPARPIKYIAGK